LENWFKIEFIFAKNLHIIPSELDKMEFYRVEYMLQNYEEFIKEENKQATAQNKQQEKQMSSSKYGSKPNLGGYNVPKMSIPKMNVPKF